MLTDVNAEIRTPAFLMQFVNGLTLPYIEFDTQGKVVRVNHALLDLTAPELGDPIGHFIWEVLPPVNQEATIASFQQHLATGAGLSVVRRSIFTRSGCFRTFDLYRSLLRNSQGSIVGMCDLAVDVTDSVIELEEAQREQQWHERVLAALPDAILVTDALGVVVYANQALVRLIGWPIGELCGKVIEDLPLARIHASHSNTAAFHLVLEAESRQQAILLARQGEKFRIEIHSTPMVDAESGCTTGIVASIRRVRG
jgi:PAS domain S-box-containing protein